MEQGNVAKFISYAEIEAANAYFEAIKGYAKHEDGLLHNRVSWCLLFNSFLFTALALLTAEYPALQQPFPVRLPILDIATTYKAAALSIALTGFVLTMSSAMGVVAATTALRKLETTWCKNKVSFQHWELYPSLLGAGSRSANGMGIAYPRVLIGALLGVWFAVFMVVIRM